MLVLTNIFDFFVTYYKTSCLQLYPNLPNICLKNVKIAFIIFRYFYYFFINVYINSYTFLTNTRIGTEKNC